jgi:hypothetical protein
VQSQGAPPCEAIAASQQDGVNITIGVLGLTTTLTNATIVGAGEDGLHVTPKWADDIILTNLIISDSADYAVNDRSTTYDPVVRYCDVYDSGLGAYYGMTDPTGTTGNVAVDPVFTDATAFDSDDWDVHLGSASPLLDAGDPAIYDADASRSDMGAFGGPNGSWP